MSVPRPAPDVSALWQQPSTPHPTAVDAVEVAWGPSLVLIRSSLGRTPVGVTPGAWAAFVAAVRAGEFDPTRTPDGDVPAGVVLDKRHSRVVLAFTPEEKGTS
ncbi:DUF397 domain-containing protein [Frankia sp. Cpl3]|uniref:DUF397 domain-containing protein n=1 Tax=Parafrankia colletiae TaxID=573497 RepID=UPI0009FD2B06|nr:DUF397 domain-containing protein [Parafrankia colletiae]MCK9904191.1 DUF397 domain-containing protein [Frankia sp. Cpl3]